MFMNRVSVLYCCILDLLPGGLEQILSHLVSGVRNLGAAKLEGSGSGSLMRFGVSSGAAVSSEDLMEAGRSSSNMTPSHAWKVIVPTWTSS